MSDLSRRPPTPADRGEPDRFYVELRAGATHRPFTKWCGIQRVLRALLRQVAVGQHGRHSGRAPEMDEFVTLAHFLSRGTKDGRSRSRLAT